LMKQNDFVFILPRQNVVIQYIMSEVTSYSRAMSMLTKISNRDCVGNCKRRCIRKIRNVLESEENPFRLTRYTRRKLSEKLEVTVKSHRRQSVRRLS
jgi:hypothetical protein